MTNTSTHHAFCFTLFTLVCLAFGVAFASSLASSPSLQAYAYSPRATVVSPNHQQTTPAQTQAPGDSAPCSADRARIQVAL